MNPVLIAAEVAAVAALVAGQLYDCYTTYVGVFVQKTEKENGTGLAKLLTANKYTTLLIKPLVCLGAGVGLFIAANSVHTGQAIDSIMSHGAVFVPCVIGAVLGITVGSSNAAANKASLVAKKS